MKARYKDYNLLMLLSLLSGALVILCSIIAQTINEQIDPRIRAEQTVRETEAQPRTTAFKSSARDRCRRPHPRKTGIPCAASLSPPP